MNETNGFGLHLADPDGSARWKREADEQAARFAREREQEREQERQRNEQAEMRNADDEQREAAERWDRHVRDLIQQQHDFQIEVVAGALAEMRKAIETETTKAIRIAVLEILPKVMEERERLDKVIDAAIGEAIEKLRGEFRAEMQTNLRIAILEQHGLVPHVKGTWQEGVSYCALDICIRDGTAWIAKYSNPGPLPGEGWQILSCKGERGKPGPMGPRGERGEKGDPGLEGPAGTDIIDWQVNPTALTVTPRMRDGSYAPSIDLMPLFQAYDAQVRGTSPAEQAGMKWMT